MLLSKRQSSPMQAISSLKMRTYVNPRLSRCARSMALRSWTRRRSWPDCQIDFCLIDLETCRLARATILLDGGRHLALDVRVEADPARADAPRAVDRDQRRVAAHAERVRHGLVGVEHDVSHLQLRRIGPDEFRRFADVDRDHVDARVAAAEALDQRDRVLARRAPGRPEVEEHEPAAMA